MFDALERWVAGRYLRPRREEGLASVIAICSFVGILLGVATLIVVLAVMTGYRAQISGLLIGLDSHLAIEAGPEGLADHQALAAQAAQLPGVTAALPLVQGQALASAGEAATGVAVTGLAPADLAGRATIAEHLFAGSLQNLSDDQLVIGSRLALRLGVGLHDRITLVSPSAGADGVTLAPRSRAFTVGGIFQVGMPFYDSTAVFMPLAGAQRYFDQGERVSAVGIMVAEPQELQPYRDALAPLLGDGRQLTDWQTSNAQLFNALKVERVVMFLILSLIIMVAAFNIIAGMIMLVKGKARDIAIMRTMGATRGCIMRIFFLSGAAIGVVGTLAGLLLGIGFAGNVATLSALLQQIAGSVPFAAEIDFLAHLPSEIRSGDVISVVIMSLVLSLLATLYPAWRAAAVDPVEALRYE